MDKYISVPQPVMAIGETYHVDKLYKHYLGINLLFKGFVKPTPKDVKVRISQVAVSIKEVAVPCWNRRCVWKVATACHSYSWWESSGMHGTAGGWKLCPVYIYLST